MFESTRRLRLSRSDRQSEAVISCVPVGDWSSFVESLHPHEWEQLGRARSDKRRSDFVAGHHAAKLAICAQLATWLRPSSILIEPGVFGQPIVRCPESARVGVSIAHSGGCAVAVAFDVGHPMGIDIELIDRKREAALRSQVVDSEVSLCLAHRVPTLEMSTYLWCAKEAVGKAMLTGLTVPLSHHRRAQRGPGGPARRGPIRSSRSLNGRDPRRAGSGSVGARPGRRARAQQGHCDRRDGWTLPRFARLVDLLA